jgi:peptidoglycan/LPS O-acetylase OafA/YrhL
MMSRTHYYGLDILRLASALLVAVFHLFFWSWAGIFSTGDQTRHVFADAAQFPSAVSLTSFGWIGVDTFFVISGFVISSSTVLSSPIEFLTGRMLRLYPAVWIFASATVAVLYLVAGDPPAKLLGRYVRSLLLIPLHPWIDGVYWTLSAEISFYAVVFLCLLLKRVSMVQLAWALTIISGAFNIFYLFVMLGIVHTSAIAVFISLSLLPGLALLPYGGEFALGIWLWVGATTVAPTVLQQVGRLFALCVSGFQVYAHTLQIAAFVPALTNQSTLVPISIFLFSSFLMFLFTQSNGSFRVLPKSVEIFVRYVGLITYPFYLVHNLVGAGISRVLIENGLGGKSAILLTLCGLLFSCWLFCWGLEPVLRKNLQRCLNYLIGKFLRPRRSLAFLFVSISGQHRPNRSVRLTSGSIQGRADRSRARYLRNTCRNRKRPKAVSMFAWARCDWPPSGEPLQLWGSLRAAARSRCDFFLPDGALRIAISSALLLGTYLWRCSSMFLSG